MNLTNVKDEQAVTRTLTYANVIERNLSLTYASIRGSMRPVDAENMITFKKWSERGMCGGSFYFQIYFHHLVKSGWTSWTAKCRLDADYYHVGIENVSFTKAKYPMLRNLFEFGVECEFGFLAFSETIDSIRAFDLLKMQVELVDSLSLALRIAQAEAECHAAKVEELTKELNDLKQSVASVYNSIKN